MKTMNLDVLLGDAWQSVDIFTDAHIVLVGIPGAFTPACESQLPGFIQAYDTLKQKGFDEVYCLSTNDKWVMQAWAKHMHTGNSVKMVSDGNSTFSQDNDLLFDVSRLGLGMRSKRYVMIVKNGTVLHSGYDDDAYIEPLLKYLSSSTT